VIVGADAAVLFDLDGVLVDSRVAISSCIAHALEAQGLPRPRRESLERFIGPQLTLAFAELTGHPEDSVLVRACLASYRARYREASLRETSVFPGVHLALEALTEEYRLAVATSKPFVFAEPLLAALALRESFEHVAAPDLDAHRETKEETIRGALSALSASRAVMVGDRSFDIAGAHACGIPAIGVSWGIGSAEELGVAGAEVVVDHPHELPEVIAGLLS
jgi:phosphoglycolate phosphatase